MKKLLLILFIGTFTISLCSFFIQKAFASVLFSDSMMNGIDQTHWFIENQYYNNTPKGVQDNNSGNWTNLLSKNINFQNDNTLQVSVQISNLISNTTLQCRRNDALGDIVHAQFSSDGTGGILFRHGGDNIYNFNWNNSPGVHVLGIVCVGSNATVIEDGTTILSKDFTSIISGSYYQFSFSAGNNIYSDWKYCDSVDCAASASTDLNVPLLKQTDPAWGSQTYDSANLWSPIHPTIGDWGCAMTSSAMVLEYYGINKLPDNTNLDPGTLNTWLKNQPDGYVGDGLINWLAVSRLSKLAKEKNPLFAYDALEYRRATTAAILADDLNHKQPDILQEPGHFIVAKGMNGSTFDINDPYYSRNDLTSGYNNTFLSLGRYIPSHTNLSYLLFTVDPSVDILLASSSGQKIGSDGTKNFSDITSADYFTQPGITDPITGLTSNSLKELMVPVPSDGEYIVSVNSNSNTSQNFTLNAYAYTATGSALISTVSDSVKNNQPTAYALSYQQDPSTDFINSYCMKGAKLNKDQRSFCHLLRKISR